MFGSITTDTITIPAPPAAVWAVYTDIEHWSEWTASVTTARLDPNGPLALGSRASIKQPRFPQVTWTVTDTTRSAAAAPACTNRPVHVR